MPKSVENLSHPDSAATQKQGRLSWPVFPHSITNKHFGNLICICIFFLHFRYMLLFWVLNANQFEVFLKCILIKKPDLIWKVLTSLQHSWGMGICGENSVLRLLCCHLFFDPSRPGGWFSLPYPPPSCLKGSWGDGILRLAAWAEP